MNFVADHERGVYGSSFLLVPFDICLLSFMLLYGGSDSISFEVK